MDNKEKVYKLIVDSILDNNIKTPWELETKKIALAKEFAIGDIPRNADIILSLPSMNLEKEQEKKVKQFLQTKPVRTLSGVANIAVMWKGDCDGNCVYCPNVDGIPRSYTGKEPATMRAQRNVFDASKQIQNRLKQLRAIGHPVEKCELIIMGGNFLVVSEKEREKFMKACLKTFEKENAKIIGLTFETRPDFCTDKNIKWMLDAGCTRVEIGAQSTDDEILEKVQRGHTNKDTKDAIKKLKDAGLKVCLHWMPGLTGINGKIDIQKEIDDFKELFTINYSPDELKIYPVLVIPGTKLHEMWKDGSYDALTNEQTMKLLIELKKFVPEYVRIKRIMRDIPEQLVEHGPRTTNLRQLVQEAMEKTSQKCKCIRCREIRSLEIDENTVKLDKIEYTGSGKREIFLQFITKGKIIGFLRLRLEDDKALVRELHVYGPMLEIGEKGENSEKQHKSYGQRLLKEAEKIAKSSNCGKIQVTSGIGVRKYYEKLGYKLEKPYMTKKL